jgi:hypothetical protein
MVFRIGETALSNGSTGRWPFARREIGQAGSCNGCVAVTQCGRLNGPKLDHDPTRGGEGNRLNAVVCTP